MLGPWYFGYSAQFWATQVIYPVKEVILSFFTLGSNKSQVNRMKLIVLCLAVLYKHFQSCWFFWFAGLLREEQFPGSVLRFGQLGSGAGEWCGVGATSWKSARGAALKLFAAFLRHFLPARMEAGYGGSRALSVCTGRRVQGTPCAKPFENTRWRKAEQI